jgi:probable phosphoglycerate mutase
MSHSEIILVRHGETVWNIEGRLQGQLDSSLSELGIAQAKAIANRLQQEDFSAIYSSDLDRAYQTAIQIAALNGHKVVTDKRLREKHIGVFEGLTITEAQAKYPEVYQAYLRQLVDYAIPGGESLAQIQQRAVNVFDELVQRHAKERLVVVSHGGLLSSFISHILGIPLGVPRRFTLCNASLTVVSYGENEEAWHVMTFGDVSHLKCVDQT